MSLPPVWRAYAQLYRAVRTIPTCGRPVGEGQNRTRTSVPVAVVVRGSGAEDIRPSLVARRHVPRAPPPPGCERCPDDGGMRDAEAARRGEVGRDVAVRV